MSMLKKPLCTNHTPLASRLVGGGCERKKKSIYDSFEFSTLLSSCAIQEQHINIERGETFAFQDLLSTDVAREAFSARPDHLVISVPLHRICKDQGAFSCFDKAKIWTLRDSSRLQHAVEQSALCIH
jgi:hypothetical protein